MSNFPSYVLAGILRSVGEPKKSGFLGRKLIVRTKALDLGIHQLLKIGVAAGAGRPVAALRIIVDSFDRDWDLDSVRELVDFIDVGPLVAANPDEPPWDIMAGPEFEDLEDGHIPWKWLGEPQLALHYTGWFTQALLWGVLHRREAIRALEADLTTSEESAARWKAAGLETSPDAWPESIEGLFEACDDLVSDFESERRLLAGFPIVLLEEQRISKHSLVTVDQNRPQLNQVSETLPAEQTFSTMCSSVGIAHWRTV
jgi:hypothetical protein